LLCERKELMSLNKLLENSISHSSETESESESNITTDGQSASLSWNKAPIWGLRITARQLRVC
jgi:hypothetical protein